MMKILILLVLASLAILGVGLMESQILKFICIVVIVSIVLFIISKDESNVTEEVTEDKS